MVFRPLPPLDNIFLLIYNLCFPLLRSYDIRSDRLGKQRYRCKSCGRKLTCPL